MRILVYWVVMALFFIMLIIFWLNWNELSWIIK
jgi:hypothetical protein